ncbi:MAG: hypothetical protein K2N30_04270 [Clostridia bacterium]|nr:hypothetical protein [Clostridia bacterium]
MQFKSDDKLKKYLTKEVEHDIRGKSWKFNGIKFTSWSSYFTKDFHTIVDYVCDLRQISVKVSRGVQGYTPYQLIAEKIFDGDNAISECINWTVDKLIEIYKVLNERVAPYVFNKDLYEQAINKPIQLQEG